MKPSAPLIATVLDPGDRARLDAAAQGRFLSLHTNSVRDVIRVVREGPVHAVLLSASRMDRRG